MIKIGMMLGERYEILEKIGTGGMSDVYKSKDHKLNRNIAVKVLKQEFSENNNFVSKFKTEAQAAAGLMHPNIVNVYDVGSEAGIWYIVMELVEGITLKKYIEKKIRLSYKEAVSIAIQVSNGIEAAHNNHIIHRDIKPQNIIISKEGKVKVTDFGIAKAATNNTVSSNVMGSVHYTSPEQARGGFSDERSDIYSLGITMFEMLTGRVPFNGDTTVAIAIKHIQEPLPYPSDYVDDVPISVEQIVLKCCQKVADRRYQSMAELLVDLKKSLSDPDGDFVKNYDPDAEGATRNVTPDEIAKIRSKTPDEVIEGKSGSGSGRNSEKPQTERNDKSKSKSSSGSNKSKNSNSKKNKVDRKGYVDEYDEYDEYDEDDYPSNGERITTILIVVAAILIGLVIVFFIGRATGIIGGGVDGEDEELIEESLLVMPEGIIGSNVDDAKRALIDLGLTPQIEYEVSLQYPENTVIAASVNSGEQLNEGDVVVLTVAQATEGVTVPSVAGMTQAEGKSTLEQHGFKVSIVQAESGSVEKGVIISQSPEGETSAPAGSTIMITVSSGGSSIEKNSVPNVIGLSEMDAMATLTEHGLTVGSITETNNDDPNLVGQVCYQSVTAGSFVADGTTIDLYVSIGPKSATYKYSGNITAPTEDEDFINGMYVQVVITAADGTQLLSTTTTTFPLDVNYTGINAATGTVTYTFEVSSEAITYTDPETGVTSTQPADSFQKTVTRELTFVAE